MDIDIPESIRYLKKTAFGTYKVVDDAEFLKSQYFFIPMDDFFAWTDRLALEIEEMEIKAEKKKKFELSAARNEAEEKINELEKKIAALSADELEEKEKSAEKDEIIKKILNINKELSNKDRNLRPRKDHSGFIVCRSKEVMFTRESFKVAVWETTLQTPYAVTFSADEMTHILDHLFYESGEENSSLIPKVKTLSDCPLYMLGLTGMYTWSYTKLEYQSHCEQNFILDLTKDRDFRQGYWMLHIVHTLPLGSIPTEMLP